MSTVIRKKMLKKISVDNFVLQVSDHRDWSDLPAHFQPGLTKPSVPQRRESGPGYTSWAQGTWCSWRALTPQEAGQLVGCVGWASTASHVVLGELKPRPLIQQIQLIPKGFVTPQASSITHYTAGSPMVPRPMLVGKPQSSLEKQCHWLLGCRANVCLAPGCLFRTSNSCCWDRSLLPQ